MNDSQTAVRTLFQVGGTNVPEGPTKTIEDELFGGCFRVFLFFFLASALILFPAIVLVIYMI